MQIKLPKAIKKLRLKLAMCVVSKNRKQVLRKLKTKLQKKEKLNVIFYIFDETKWKAQSLYDLMEKSEEFSPFVCVSKNSAKINNFDYLSKEKILSVYNFFKTKSLNTFLAYDFEKNKYISFEDMNSKADIIIYCSPWNIPKIHSPLRASKNAFTIYIPYAVSVTKSYIEYNLELHNLVFKHYIMSELFKGYYSKNALNKGKNLIAVGNPILDYFYLNKDKPFKNENYIIYAPHYSVDDKSILNWGTFFEFGEYILNFAKNHPEYNWIFKPHPALRGYLLNNTNYTKKQLNKYWSEWENIGKICDSGDYLDLFMKSKLLISDCGSFKVEYFMTKKPQIFLKSSRCKTEYNTYVEKINNSCYQARNIKELEKILDEVLIKENDYKKNERLELFKELNLENQYCAKNILEDLIKTISS